MSIDGRWFSHVGASIGWVSTAAIGQPDVGSELTVDDVSVLISDMCRKQGIRPSCV